MPHRNADSREESLSTDTLINSLMKLLPCRIIQPWHKDDAHKRWCTDIWSSIAQPLRGLLS